MSRVPAVAVAACLLAVAGCANPAKPRPATTPVAGLDAEGYRARTAAALVFDPPATADLDADRLADALDRTGRGASAVLGYDSPVVESSLVYVDDRQILYGGSLGVGSIGAGFYSGGLGYGGFAYAGGFGGTGAQYDRYERRAVSTREFTRVRP